MKLVICLLVHLCGVVVSSTSSEIEAEELFDSYEKDADPYFYDARIASWNHSLNPTYYSYNKMVNAGDQLDQIDDDFLNRLKKYNWREFKNENLKRKFQLTLLTPNNLPGEKYNMFMYVKNLMRRSFTDSRVCDYKERTKCDLNVDPDLENIFTHSRDPEELVYYWKAWHDVMGKKARRHYNKFVELANENARINNFKDNSKLLIAEDIFESDTFEEDMEKLWLNIEPLYKDLHAYVRGKLNEFYGDDIVSKDGPIPGHLLGTIWSHIWTNIMNLTTPYPDKPSVDVTQEMIKQGYTVLKMFQTVDEFFLSLNMSSVPESFWKLSVFEKPENNKDFGCQPIAKDLNNGKDFVIRMCAEVNQNDLVMIHHEVGHIQYFMQYKDLPKVYRTSANAGFHEAVGDAIAMSVVTPKHLKRIGLLPEDFTQENESTINFLFLQALNRIALLPYSYTLDKWRWDVYQGKSTEEDYNCHYWKLRVKYQGIQPPVERSEESLDPVAKYHVAADKGYIRYFVSNLVQYQFHKALCVAAGEFNPENPEENPLYDCDIYKSVKAGEKFKNMLKLGASKPWPIALETLTGTRSVSTDDLLEYFKPLQDWLQQENKKKGYPTGWSEPTVNFCKKSASNS